MQTIFKITEQLKVRKFLFGKIFKLFDLTNSTFQLKLLVTKSIWYMVYVCSILYLAYSMRHTLYNLFDMKNNS